jgi:hypothetical protein
VLSAKPKEASNAGFAFILSFLAGQQLSKPHQHNPNGKQDKLIKTFYTT